MATHYDLQIEARAGFKVTFVNCNPLAGSNPPQPDPSSPISNTGWAAVLTIAADNTPNGRQLVRITVANGGIVLGGANGQFVCTLTGDQTGALEDGVYDLLVTPTGGGAQPQRLAQGKVTMLPGVSVAGP